MDKEFEKLNEKQIFNVTGTACDLFKIPNSIRLPRNFIIKNVPENENFYIQLLQLNGETVRIGSDQFNGLFEVIHENDEILLKEIIQ